MPAKEPSKQGHILRASGEYWFTPRIRNREPTRLQEHQWLVEDAARTVDMAGWVAKAMEWKRQQRNPKPEELTKGS